jgi:hypothetical protein
MGLQRRLRRLRPPAAGGLAVLSVACVFLPWWRADQAPVLLVDGPPLPLAPDSWTGADLLGIPLAIGLAALAALAAVMTTPRRATSHPFGALRTPPAGCEVTRRGAKWALPVVGLVGAATAAGGSRVLATSGPGATPGAWAAVALGAAAVVVAVGRPRLRAAPVLAAALVGTLVTGVLPGTDAAAADGPYVRLAELAATGPLRSGATALPAGSGLALTVVDGAAAAVTDDGIANVAHGRVTVLARVPADDRIRHAGGILGVAGDRVARFVAPGALLVTGLRAGDPTAVRVLGVAEASRVGTDGTVWLRGYGEPAATIRRLDLRAYGGASTLDVTMLPVVTIDAPVGTAPLAAADLLPVPRGALRRTANRLERVTVEPGRTVVTPVAGGLDPACGLTAVARNAALAGPGPFAAAADGGAWVAASGRLLRVGSDGVLRAVRASLPGPVTALVTTPDGAVVLATRQGALWALPPGAPLEDLPLTRSDCVPDPRPAGPPVALVPVANTGPDRLGVPLGVDGRWASGTRDGQITAVSADGRTRTPLGTRSDGALGPVWPDGAGGVWWLEGSTPVHAHPGAPQVRLPPVAVPANDIALIPDLGGRPPLVATPAGAYRLDGTRLVDGPVTGGVVRADGRGWLLQGGRVLALAGGRVLGPVIDGGGLAAPVAVQLAHNVPPTRLRLGDAALGLDAQGRVVVIADGVVLAVTMDGAVRPVAQDPRLTTPIAVEGGLVQRGDDGTLLRVDLPG